MLILNGTSICGPFELSKPLVGRDLYSKFAEVLMLNFKEMLSFLVAVVINSYKMHGPDLVDINNPVDEFSLSSNCTSVYKTIELAVT